MGEKSQYITFDQIKLLVSKVEIIGVWQNLKLNSVMFCRPHHLTSVCVSGQRAVGEFMSVASERVCVSVKSLCDYQAIVWLSSIGVSVQCLCDCQEFGWVFSDCVIVQSSESEFVWVQSECSEWDCGKAWSLFMMMRSCGEVRLLRLSSARNPFQLWENWPLVLTWRATNPIMKHLC